MSILLCWFIRMISSRRKTYFFLGNSSINPFVVFKYVVRDSMEEPTASQDPDPNPNPIPNPNPNPRGWARCRYCYFGDLLARFDFLIKM
jgi:hypothetical protein